MKFGPIPPREAVGGLLAHAHRVASASFKKGRRITLHDAQALEAAGVEQVVVARLETGDVEENEAAETIGRALCGNGLRMGAPYVGRANLYAEDRGLFQIDRLEVSRLNAASEAITVACALPDTPVEPKQLVATIKVIPLAVTGDELNQAQGAATTPFSVARYRPIRVELLQTSVSGTRQAVLDKTRVVTNARLERTGAVLQGEQRCPHTEAAVAAALSAAVGRAPDLVLVIGGSATVDRRDVIPAALGRIGGALVRFGIPVDPGNLLLQARVGATTVLGLPGSARSPRPSGFDWVLQRLAAGLEVSSEWLAQLGVGGLMKEIAQRPSPRTDEENLATRGYRVAALVLAAGQSRRMGARNKLLAAVGGKPMVLRAVDAALESNASSVHVVTGHEPDRVLAALGDRAVTTVHNPEYAAGLSTSLARGLAALSPKVDGAVVCLADMPGLSGAVIDRLIEQFDPGRGRSICVPTFRGKRGNPVLWARRFFPEMQEVRGDVGARHLIGDYAERVREVEMPDAAVLDDIDSPEQLARVVSEFDDYQS